MTPIDDVFMLSIEARLDYDLLKQIVATGHSRIPVYEEIDAPASVRVADGHGAVVGHELEEGGPVVAHGAPHVDLLLLDLLDEALVDAAGHGAWGWGGVGARRRRR